MFVPLHIKSEYSLGFGTASVEELAMRAAAFGYGAIALTDLENMAEQVRFHYQCRAVGIRAITGIELRPGFDGRREFGSREGRVVLLAADRTGYRSICRIVSRRRTVPNRKIGAALQEQDLSTVIQDEPEGLFALSDDRVLLEKLLAGGRFSRERLGFLLVRPGDRKRQEASLEHAIRLGIRPVADLDAVIPDPEDHRLHALQVAIRQGKRLSEVLGSPAVESIERRLRAPAEAAALFSDIPEALEAAADIADRCRFDFSELGTTPPAMELPAGARLKELCMEEAQRRKRAGTWTRGHAERLDFELSQIELLGLSGLMLIAGEIVSFCRSRQIPVVARGSAVSSLALNLLGASPVDPVEARLIFERFLHPGKSEWPDIDLDVPSHRRDELIDWVYRHFGRDRVAMVAAYHSFQRRSALREGLKALGIGPTLIEMLSRSLPPDDLDVAEFDFLGLVQNVELSSTPDAGMSLSPHSGLGEMLPLVQRLIGKPRNLAVHPGGIIIDAAPLNDRLPLDRAPKGVVVTQYDLSALAELRIVKIDLLGNRALAEIEETLELAGIGGPSILEAFPDEDPETLALIGRAQTLGCFQLESPAMRSLLSRMPIRSESDVTAALALIRPGVAAGETKAAFIRRTRGEEACDPIDPVMADRLFETRGMLLYEEDIMVLLSRISGMSLGEADELRSAIVKSGGDPEILAKLEAGFLKRCSAAGGPFANDLYRLRRAWAAAAKFAAYAFNKAHAASYARLAYISAYLKTNMLQEFACALMNHHIGIYPLRTLAADLMRGGVVIKPPHVNLSQYFSILEEPVGWVESRNKRDATHHPSHRASVRIGLEKIKGLSAKTVEKILKERETKGPFANFSDLLQRVRIGRGELAALVLSGACDDLSPLFAGDYPFAHEAVLEFLKRGETALSLDEIKVSIQERGVAHAKLYQELVRVRNELRYLEMHLSGHPTALLRSEAERYGCVPIAIAAESKPGSRMRLLVIMAAMRRVPTRSGVMQFLTLEDETGLLEAVVLPPAYRAIGDRITTPGPFLVEGTLQSQQNAVHLEVFRLSPFHQRRQPFEK